MEWTAKVPTEKGFYWRSWKGHGAHIVEIGEAVWGRGLAIHSPGTGNDEDTERLEDGWQWLGPLNPPRPPGGTD